MMFSILCLPICTIHPSALTHLHCMPSISVLYVYLMRSIVDAGVGVGLADV